jgi:SHS2 domain-containing protein
MHELFEHTADLGLRATAPDLNTLFAEMGKCLLSAMVEDPASVVARQIGKVVLKGDNREFLLFDWLKELLLRFEMDRVLISAFNVHRVDEAGLVAEVAGEPYDPARHVLAHEVKAITYHELKVEKTADGWLAEAIVDI